MITPDPEHLRQSTLAAREREARFWQRMSELGIPEGPAWEALRIVLAEIEGGTDHPDPWTVTADRLTHDPQWRRKP